MDNGKKQRPWDASWCTCFNPTARNKDPSSELQVEHRPRPSTPLVYVLFLERVISNIFLCSCLACCQFKNIRELQWWYRRWRPSWFLYFCPIDTGRNSYCEKAKCSTRRVIWASRGEPESPSSARRGTKNRIGILYFVFSIRSFVSKLLIIYNEEKEQPGFIRGSNKSSKRRLRRCQLNIWAGLRKSAGTKAKKVTW